MPADDKIMEALARIEHKLDLLLGFSSQGTKLRQVGDAGHLCPVCRQAPEYQIDINDAVVIRKCGCSTGKIPLDLKAFAPTIKKKEQDNGRDEEDRSDPAGGIRRPGGRNG